MQISKQGTQNFSHQNILHWFTFLLHHRRRRNGKVRKQEDQSALCKALVECAVPVNKIQLFVDTQKLFSVLREHRFLYHSLGLLFKSPKFKTSGAFNSHVLFGPIRGERVEKGFLLCERAGMNVQAGKNAKEPYFYSSSSPPPLKAKAQLFFLRPFIFSLCCSADGSILI